MVLGVSSECQDVLTCRIFRCTEFEVSVVASRKNIVIPVAVGSSLVFILLSFSNKRHLQCPDVSILSILGHSLSHAPIPNTCLWILYRPSASEFTDDRHRCDFNWSSISDCPAWVTRLGCRFFCTLCQSEYSVEVTSSNVGECYNTSYAVLYRLVSIASFFVSACVSTVEVEGIAINVPSWISTTSATIHTLDSLTTLAAVHEDIISNIVGKPCLVVLTMSEEVLTLSNVIHRILFDVEGLNCQTCFSSLLATL